MVQERLTKLNHEIPLDFPPNVLAAAAELEKRAAEGAADLGGLKPLGSVEDALPIDRVSKASTSKRQDLRGVPFVTIDGEDARASRRARRRGMGTVGRHRGREPFRAAGFAAGPGSP